MSIIKGDEELLGHALSQLIVNYAKEKIIVKSFRVKYKPVAQGASGDYPEEHTTKFSFK